MINRRKFLKHAGFAAASAVAGRGVLAFADSAKQAKPNFLIIMADDCTYNDLPMEIRPEYFDRVVKSYFTVVIDKHRAT